MGSVFDVVNDRALHFPAFQLADHSGTFDYGDAGDVTVEYDAVELPGR